MSMNKKEYSPHIIKIFLDKSIHYGRIFLTKSYMAKYSLTQSNVTGYFLTKKNFMRPILGTVK
jgi:hypothetical protein